MKSILLICFSLFISNAFGQSRPSSKKRSKPQRQMQLFLQEKGGSFVKVNSSGKLYVSGGEDFSFHLLKNPNNSKEAIVVDDKYNLQLGLSSNSQPLFTRSGSYFEVTQIDGQSPGFLIVQNGAYLSFSEGEFRWESDFNFANALWLRPKSRAVRPDRSDSRDISGRGSGQSTSSGRSSAGGRSSTSSSSAGATSNKSKSATVTPKPSPPPPPKTGSALIKFNCDRCYCSSYKVILKPGGRLPNRDLGRFNKNCQLSIPDLSPGYYKIEVQTVSGGDQAEGSWVTIKIDRQGFSVVANRTETIPVRQTGW